MRQYVQSHAQDELLKIYRREYMRRFAWIRVEKFSRKNVPRGVRKRRRKKRSARAARISQRKFVQWLKR